MDNLSAFVVIAILSLIALGIYLLFVKLFPLGVVLIVIAGAIMALSGKEQEFIDKH